MSSPLFNFQPPSTASDVFRLASLMVYYITNGKTYIKSHKEVAVITSQTHPWLHARYSSDLMRLLGRMLSTKPEKRPTAEEIEEETSKNKRQKQPELLPTARLEDFLAVQLKMVALLPKTSYQRKGETITFDQWNGWLGERIESLRKQAGESGAGGGLSKLYSAIFGGATQASESEPGGGMVNVGESINWLSGLLMRLQDRMTSADLTAACSLFRSIEEMAKIKEE